MPGKAPQKLSVPRLYSVSGVRQSPGAIARGCLVAVALGLSVAAAGSAQGAERNAAGHDAALVPIAQTSGGEDGLEAVNSDTLDAQTGTPSADEAAAARSGPVDHRDALFSNSFEDGRLANSDTPSATGVGIGSYNMAVGQNN